MEKDGIPRGKEAAGGRWQSGCSAHGTRPRPSNPTLAGGEERSPLSWLEPARRILASWSSSAPGMAALAAPAARSFSHLLQDSLASWM